MRGTVAMTAIDVELCGRLADLAGRQVTLAVAPGGLAVADLFAALAAEHPALADPLAAGKVRACVNEVIVPASAIVRPGDLVALFPPVSGG
jgi:sulfur-carrier protein